MSFQSDIQEYKAARNQAAALYAQIGTDRDAAVAKRNERWAVNKRKREAGENIIDSEQRTRFAAALLSERNRLHTESLHTMR